MKTAREVLEKLVMPTLPHPLTVPKEFALKCGKRAEEKIDQALSDLAEIVRGLQKPTEGISHESVRDNNGKHTGTLKIPVTYPLSEAYNQAITDIAKLFEAKD